MNALPPTQSDNPAAPLMNPSDELVLERSFDFNNTHFKWKRTQSSSLQTKSNIPQLRNPIHDTKKVSLM